MSQPETELSKLLAASAAPGLVGLIVGLIGGIVQDRYGSWLAWLRGLLAAVIVAILIGLWIQSAEFSIYLKFGIMGVCAFVAADLLDALTMLGGMVKADPVGLLQRVRAAMRGDKGGTGHHPN